MGRQFPRNLNCFKRDVHLTENDRRKAGTNWEVSIKERGDHTL